MTGRGVTQSYYDWQDRLVAENNGLQVTYNTLDNLGEITQAQIYDATQSNTQISMGTDGVPQPPDNASALRAQTKTLYDNQGRAYCSFVYSVDPNSGAVGNRLETDIYHDGRGDVVATQAPGGLVRPRRTTGRAASRIRRPAVRAAAARSPRSCNR